MCGRGGEAISETAPDQPFAPRQGPVGTSALAIATFRRKNNVPHPGVAQAAPGVSCTIVPGLMAWIRPKA